MLTYSSLRDIQKREIEGGGLVELGEDFYSQVLDFLKVKKEEAKSGSMLKVREYGNVKRILSIIQVKREEKILLMALRSEKSHIGLTKEERDLFLKVQQTVSDHRNTLTFNTPVKNIQKVRILKDVEQYKGTDNKVYGPFVQGESHIIPRTEAEWLLKENLAELTV